MRTLGNVLENPREAPVGIRVLLHGWLSEQAEHVLIGDCTAFVLKVSLFTK